MALGMSIGIRALLSAKTVMDMIGHNLANQNTPGYSRQIALLMTTDPISGPKNIPMGTGVVVDDIFSVRNEALLSRIRTEMGTAGRADTESSMLEQMESILGDLTDNSIATKIQALFDSADAAASKPEDQVLRQNLMSSVSEVALNFRLRHAGIQDQRTTSLFQAQSLVKDANSDLKRIADLNGKITSQVAIGTTPNDLLDQRSVILERLAETLGANAIPLKDGSVAVSVKGVTLVTGVSAIPIQSTMDGAGTIHLLAGKGGLEIDASNGKVGALVQLTASYMPDRLADLDKMARALILNANRVHGRGVPSSGPFSELKSNNAVTISSGTNPLTQKLEDLGLPFDMKKGTLSIAVTDEATGDVTRTDVAVDPASMSLQDFVDAIDAVPNMSAFVDGAGKLTLKAAAGFGFDFSQRLDPHPVEGGTFGATNAIVVGSQFPAALSNGSTLQIAVDGGAPQTVTFNSANFANIAQATAAETAAEINTQVAGVTASVVDGRLVIASNSTGAASALQVTDGAGSPAAALGLALAGTGADDGVSVEVSGSNATAGPDTFTFKPTGDGQIGVTPNLGLQVYDSKGALVTTLNIGDGYDPGSPLEVVEGVNVKLGPGTVQGSSGQYFDLDVPGDTDTADVLPAFGLNALFEGKDSATIELAGELKGDPSQLAGAALGGPGDGGTFLKLAGLSTQNLAELDDSTVLHSYNAFATEVGSASASAKESLKSSSLVLLTLQSQRSNESGVNQDEELLNLERFQSAYQSAGKYLSVMTDLNQVLLNL